MIRQTIKFIKICKIFIISAICLLLFENPSFVYGFEIRKERIEKNGVLIVMPSRLDRKIVKILNNNKIRSVEDYSHWLEKNIKYVKDKERDNWATPEETLQRKYGDCEDYAFLNAAVLRVFGYKARVVGMKGLTGCHAVCVFKEEDGYISWIDNTELRKTTARSMREFAGYLFRKYGCTRPKK